MSIAAIRSLAAVEAGLEENVETMSSTGYTYILYRESQTEDWQYAEILEDRWIYRSLLDEDMVQTPYPNTVPTPPSGNGGYYLLSDAGKSTTPGSSSFSWVSTTATLSSYNYYVRLDSFQVVRALSWNIPTSIARQPAPGFGEIVLDTRPEEVRKPSWRRWLST